MAAWRRAIELSLGDSDVEELRLIARSRTEPANRVERARILLGYWENSSFFAVGRALGLHHQTVQRCVERAVAEGPVAALDERPRPGREPTITLEAKAWLTSLSCRKAKELGYPHELWTTRLLARHAREHGPAEGHPCLANTKMTVARLAARLVLRRLKGRVRKSSPSSVRMSKAYGWTSSSCLRECRTLKSGTPSTPRMTASPSTN